MNRSKSSNGKMLKSLTFETDMDADGYRLINSENKPPDIKHNKENAWVAGVQMFISFLVAGFGMVAASLLLDFVQHWPVFKEVSEVYILVPALLGLKGNLEMTLASRLSTHAHLGHLDTHLGELVFGNLCLIQCQAVLVGFLAAMAAVAMGWIPYGEFDIHHAMLLCASSVLTASLASFVLGLIMIGVIVISRMININPDNIATPIAASLGDLSTLALLSWIASLLYNPLGTSIVLSSIIVIIGAALVPVCGYIAWKNQFTRQALDEGWVPVVSAMVISSAGGLILDYTVSKYKGVAVFQLVINGIGGNMVAVHASRLSTSLHTGQKESSVIGKTTKLLLVMVIPGQLIFLYTIGFLRAGHTSLTVVFILVYMTAALTQVFLLLTISYYMVMWMWKLGMDPDNSAIPYLTALGDLLGTALLGLAFIVLDFIGDKDADVGD
ncbi:solute carrier family 41 member 1 isoform X1 [Amyelois transitella]|uniref:solute carrier family 41 member 1 isoform X1 n=2 Tax=Amyelois transitella TaxID=680683 RepID=UPI00298FEFA7|nr:solute carrier family 41 member 1 isoform X1 [Amyelois transitella]